MARFRVSIKPYQSDSRPQIKWVLNVWHPTGKRERRFFSTKEAALAEEQIKQVEVQNLGIRALGISDRLRLEALDAQEKLAPFKVTLTEVVTDYIRRHGSPTAKVPNVIADYVASRVRLGRSKRHLESVRGVLGRFGRAHEDRRLNDITADDIDVWLQGLNIAPLTINTYRGLLHALFAYGTAKKLCPENPVKEVERRSVKPGKVGILTSSQLEKLLHASDDDVRTIIALGAFAGPRPEELARLTWEEIDLEEGLIDIGAHKSKTAQQRYVKILPCLAAWLKPLVDFGPIQKPNFRRRFDTARRLAGFALRANQRKLKLTGDENLTPWPHDALRHSFASYHLAKFQDAAALALQMGHESNSLIFSNYRHRVKERDAVEYFDLFPLADDPLFPS